MRLFENKLDSNVNVVDLFMQGDLDAIAGCLGEVEDTIYKDGKRPLHLAALYGHVPIVKWLLAENAQVDSTDQGGHTPLHLAAKYGHTEVVDLLISSGAAVNVGNKMYKLTPLHMAAKENQRGSAEALIKAGADVSVCDKDGVQPLHVCAEKGSKEVAAVLIRAGASANVKDQIGWTPLHLAIEHKQEAMMALLLKLGADPDTPNKNGWTPLHLAAYSGSVSAVRTLLEYGANLSVVNSVGMTPQELAVEQQHAAVVPLLNPATAAQLACPALVGRGSSITTELPSTLLDDALAPVTGLPGVDLPSIDSLLGGLGLKDQADAACPYCSIDPGTFLNPNPAAGRDPTAPQRSLSAAGSSVASSGSSSSSSTAMVVPSLFVCPLSQKVLKDPVVACDGFTYDRRAIQEWFESGQRTSPLTKQPLRSTATLPNHVVRCAVTEWLEWREKRVQYMIKQQQQ